MTLTGRFVFRELRTPHPSDGASFLERLFGWRSIAHAEMARGLEKTSTGGIETISGYDLWESSPADEENWRDDLASRFQIGSASAEPRNIVDISSVRTEQRRPKAAVKSRGKFFSSAPARRYIGRIVASGAARSQWLSHVVVPELEQALHSARTHGFTSKGSREVIAGLGARILLEDPLAAQFYMLQVEHTGQLCADSSVVEDNKAGNRRDGAALHRAGSGKTGTISERENEFFWSELACCHPRLAVQCYSRWLGWETKSQFIGDLELYLFHQQETLVASVVNDVSLAGGAAGWIPYVLVSDLTATVASARQLGAVVSKPAVVVAGRGTFAVIEHHGAILALWQQERP